MTQGYKAVVRLDSQTLVLGNDRTDHGMPLEAGMVVMAEIKQGHRTVIEYLLSPVQKVVSEAGRER
jgi:HlyD family secretion protein